MSQLVQVIYVSSEAYVLQQSDLLSILDASIRNNPPRGITGMLLYARGSFMQVLEGEESAVAETMARIHADKRHHDIFELSHTPITTREFGSWSMGFRALTPADAATWPGYAPFFQFGFDATTLIHHPGLAAEMLRTFGDKNGE